MKDRVDAMDENIIGIVTRMTVALKRMDRMDAKRERKRAAMDKMFGGGEE
jgi:hypothetical protein